MAGYDRQRERKVQRGGKEKGVRVYVAAEELRSAGIDPEAVTHYRVWADARGGVVVRLYKR